MKLDTKTRKRIYIQARSVYDDPFYSYHNGICYLLKLATEDIVGIPRSVEFRPWDFPEFRAVKPSPLVGYGEYWWPRGDNRSRIEALDKMIALAESGEFENSWEKFLRSVKRLIKKKIKNIFNFSL